MVVPKKPRHPAAQKMQNPEIAGAQWFQFQAKPGDTLPEASWLRNPLKRGRPLAQQKSQLSFSFQVEYKREVFSTLKREVFSVPIDQVGQESEGLLLHKLLQYEVSFHLLIPEMTTAWHGAEHWHPAEMVLAHPNRFLTMNFFLPDSPRSDQTLHPNPPKRTGFLHPWHLGPPRKRVKPPVLDPVCRPTGAFLGVLHGPDLPTSDQRSAVLHRGATRCTSPSPGTRTPGELITRYAGRVVMRRRRVWGRGGQCWTWVAGWSASLWLG